MAAADNQRAAGKTLEDISTQYLRAFLTAHQLPAHGTRDVCLQRLTAAHAGITEQTVLVTLGAPVLREWANVCEIPGYGNLTRAAAVCRIMDKAEGPAAAPVDNNAARRNEATNNPRAIEVQTLVNHQDRSEISIWKNDVRLSMSARMMAVEWDFLQSNATDAAKAQAILGYSEAKQQVLTLLTQGLMNSIEPELKSSLQKAQAQGAINIDGPHKVIQWIDQLAGMLGQAVHTKAMTDFKQESWAKSKVDLSTWLIRLRNIAGNFGPNIPPGAPRETYIRDKVLSSITAAGRTEIQLILDTYANRDISAEGGDNDSLIAELSKAIFKIESKGEKQCQVFAAIDCEPTLAGNTIVTNGSVQSTTPPPGFPPVPPATSNTVNVYYGGKGKGGGKKGGNGKRNNGTNKNNGGNNAGNSAGAKKHCVHCAEFMRSKGITDKAHVVASHNSAQCKFQIARNKHSQPQKSNDKPPRKGKGGGKGKGGKGGKNRS